MPKTSLLPCVTSTTAERADEYSSGLRNPARGVPSTRAAWLASATAPASSGAAKLVPATDMNGHDADVGGHGPCPVAGSNTPHTITTPRAANMLTSGTSLRFEVMPADDWKPGVPYSWLLPPVPPPAPNTMLGTPPTMPSEMGGMPILTRSFHTVWVRRALPFVRVMSVPPTATAHGDDAG